MEVLDIEGGCRNAEMRGNLLNTGSTPFTCSLHLTDRGERAEPGDDGQPRAAEGPVRDRR